MFDFFDSLISVVTLIVEYFMMFFDVIIESIATLVSFLIIIFFDFPVLVSTVCLGLPSELSVFFTIIVLCLTCVLAFRIIKLIPFL